MKSVVFAIMICCSCSVFAQHNSYSIKPGEDMNKTLADSVRFRYPAFTAGMVLFRNGAISNAALNYNLTNGEMQFIAPKGDTLALADEATIYYIAIGTDTFVYDKTYLQLIESNATAKLAKKEEIQSGDVKKEGGFGGLSSTSAITTYSSFNANGRSTDLMLRQEITVYKTTTYYIGDAFNHFLMANKRNIMKLFGKKQSALEQYFKANKVSFNNEKELIALTDYLNQ